MDRELVKRTHRLWDKFNALMYPTPKPRELSTEEKKSVDDYIALCNKRGWTRRRIKKAVKKKFNVNLV